MRIGFGYDSHVFAEERPLKLGGVLVPFPLGLKGNSDADVLIHALIDALLGAAALGDIGSHFPDTGAEWKNADSALLLKMVVEEIRAAGYEIGNVDVTVVCEQPKLRPYVDAIRSRLGEILRVPVASVSVKGKTNEGMDAVGEGRGIAVYAVALLKCAVGD